MASQARRSWSRRPRPARPPPGPCAWAHQGPVGIGARPAAPPRHRRKAYASPANAATTTATTGSVHTRLDHARPARRQAAPARRRPRPARRGSGRRRRPPRCAARSRCGCPWPRRSRSRPPTARRTAGRRSTRPGSAPVARRAGARVVERAVHQGARAHHHDPRARPTRAGGCRGGGGVGHVTRRRPPAGRPPVRAAMSRSIMSWVTPPVYFCTTRPFGATRYVSGTLTTP